MSPLIGDLVTFRNAIRSSLTSRNENEVGEVIRQTDIMSDCLTSHGVMRVRTSKLTVVQPCHVEFFTHTQGKGSANENL